MRWMGEAASSELLRCLWDPWMGFRARAARPESGTRSFLRFLAWRTPFAFAETLLAARGVMRLWRTILDPESPLWGQIRAQVPGLELAELREALALLPPPPPFGRALPTLLVLALLGVLGLWTHHLLWDHACLKLLRGLKGGLALSARAESEVLAVTSLGTAVGLLAYLPGLGCLFGPLIGALGLWCWVLRGFALAAFHGCEAWRGILATLVHALLALCFYGLLLGLLLLLFWPA